MQTSDDSTPSYPIPNPLSPPLFCVPALDTGRNPLLNKRPCLPPKVAAPNLGEDPLLNHKPHRPENQRGNRNQGKNTHPIKKNPEIGTQIYNNPKPRGLDSSTKTQSTTAKEICHHQRPAILLNISLRLNDKKKTLKPTFELILHTTIFRSFLVGFLGSFMYNIISFTNKIKMKKGGGIYHD